ncbi:MAG: hypothetical protein DRP63_00330 [Planctomycetota bacterium]|nr:MAG: hypothetical protein DRP63_00330 [Planctomycetota bacterium]
MLVKPSGILTSYLSCFELLPTKETSLSAIFAFPLAKCPRVLKLFLKTLFQKLPFKTNPLNAEIWVEKKHEHARTDIEIISPPHYHVIVECKVGAAKVKKQRTKYIPYFHQRAKYKVLCFLTQERDTAQLAHQGVLVRHLSWADILTMLDDKKVRDIPLVSDFVRFFNRRYGMLGIKEILVQDLGEEEEIERFEKFHLYKRDETYGTPLYFAPYFTKRTGRPGIRFIAKVLGVLTVRAKDAEQFIEDISRFAENTPDLTKEERHDLIDRWLKGIRMEKDKERLYTWYFLSKPLALKKPLLKAGKSGAKGWIAGMIPKNRSIDFLTFLEQIQKQSGTE